VDGENESYWQVILAVDDPLHPNVADQIQEYLEAMQAEQIL
jgi:hypothetical protein